MGTVLLSVALLIVSYSILLAGTGLQFVALGLRGGVEGFSTLSLGLITSAYFIGLAVGAVYGDRLIRHSGHSRCFAILASVLSATALAYPLWSEPAGWLLFRFLAGVCAAGLSIVTESWLNAASTNDIRGRVMSVYMLASMGGMALGPVLSNTGAADGFHLFVLASILTSISLVPILLSRADAPRPEAPAGGEDGMSMRMLARQAPLSVVGMILVAAVQGSFFGLGPVFADQAGLSPSLVSGFFSVTVLAGLVLQYPFGWLSDRFDRRKVVLVAVVICAVSGLSIYSLLAGGFSFDRRILSLFGAFLVGGITLPIYAMLVAYTNDRLPSHQLVQAAGALMLSFGIGSSVGPLAASWAMGRFGPEALFGYCGVVMALLVLFTLYRMVARPTPLLDEQTDFVVVSPTTSVLSADPRYEESPEANDSDVGVGADETDLTPADDMDESPRTG